MKKICITFSLTAPMRKNFGGVLSLGGGEKLNLGLKSIIVGIVDRVDVLNYLIILGKLCIWECRKNKRLPNFRLFQKKIGIKRETDRCIAYKNKRLPEFRKRWELFLLRNLKEDACMAGFTIHSFCIINVQVFKNNLRLC